jgi:hypothetical protein
MVIWEDKIITELLAAKDAEIARLTAELATARSAPQDGTIRLLRAVSSAAPDKKNKWAEEARIPWRLIHEIRAALAIIDGADK